MLIKFYYLCVVILLCEAATKIGLGNGRPSEEPSSLKTEVLKFKSSECGGSSSEEQPRNSKNKKPKNRNKKGSDEDDDDDDDSEENNKKKNKNNAGKNNNNTRNRQKNNRGFNREEMFTGYGSTSFEHNRHFGMNRGPPDDFMNRRQGPGGEQFPNRWDEDQNRPAYNSNPRGNRGNHGNQFNPYGPNFDGEDDFNPQNSDRRNQNRGQDPYQQPRPGSLNNRGGYPYQQDRDDNNRYNNRDRDDRYNNRDDRYSNRRKSHQNNWDDSSSEDDSSRNSGKKNGQRNNRRPNNRNGGMNGKNKKNKNSDGECISQCVFNNMQIMEDDGIPSEAGMIKWAQEKIKNDKLKQSAVKEIRKCFGTLASSDGDNSCNFSKSLSNCLKLGLDDDKD